jgi:hypothetical protein
VLRQTWAADGAGTKSELLSATRLSALVLFPDRVEFEALRGRIGVAGASA